MSAQKSPKKCPRCGSRNLEVESHDRKGRLTVYCSECDYEFELHDDSSSGQRTRERDDFRD